jgi:hypothetical protein
VHNYRPTIVQLKIACVRTSLDSRWASTIVHNYRPTIVQIKIACVRYKRFLVQIDCSVIDHLIAYVRYVEDTEINDVFFLLSLELLTISLKIKAYDGQIIGVCTDSALIMAGNTRGSSRM